MRLGGGARSRLHHPEVGELDLYREKLPITGTDGQLLIVHHAEPGSDSAHSLGLLESMTPARPTNSGAAPTHRRSDLTVKQDGSSASPD